MALINRETHAGSSEDAKGHEKSTEGRLRFLLGLSLDVTLAGACVIYLFDVFEFDSGNFALVREGKRLQLEPKAIQVLQLLVANRGKLMHKDVILREVWKETFVEESTLTRAVALIRKQLGDDPRRPRFIETIPTVGYRFIAQTTICEDCVTNEPISKKNVRTGGAESEQPGMGATEQPITSAAADSTPRRLGRRLLLLCGIALVGACSALWWGFHRTRSVQVRDGVVLDELSNSTGDPVLDGTLRQGLSVQLSQSPTLRLVSDSQIGSMLKLMNKSPLSRLSPDVGREICVRTGSAASLDGSVSHAGSNYILTLQATNCRTGERFWATQASVSHKEDLLKALSLMAIDFRKRIGESRDSIRDLDKPLPEATTSSLDALKLYNTAFQVLALQGSLAALPLLRQTLQIDPEFAMAYSALSRIYGDLGEESLSNENAAMAHRFRERASRHEQFFIDVTYQLQVLGNIEKAQETCESWKKVYPNDQGPYGFESGIIDRIFGHEKDGLENARRLIEIDPSLGMGYHLLALWHIRGGRLALAEKTLAEAETRQLAMPDFWMDRYRVAFLHSDDANMEHSRSVIEDQPGVDALIANQEAQTLAFRGKMRQARVMSQRAADFARQRSKTGLEARFEATAGLREALLGDRFLAGEHAARALELSRDRDVQYGAGFIYATIGNQDRATAIAKDLAEKFPEDTTTRFQYLPSLRALIFLRKNNPAEALDILQTAAPYELGFPQTSAVATYGALYTIFVRGLTYRALHRELEAAAEFNRILMHPGVTLNDPIGVLSRLQIARSYLASGDKPRARAAYDDLLQIWQTADVEAALVRQARLELRTVL